MMEAVRRFSLFFMALVFGFSSAYSQSKPSLVVSPLKGKNTKAAMEAIKSEFQNSGRVFVIDFEKVVEYVGGEKKGDRKKDLGKATKAFEKGKEEYQNLRLGEAISSFSTSVALYEKALLDERSFTGYRTAKFHLAMAHLARNDEVKAASELREMITLDPNREKITPSEKYYSPKIRELYKRILKEVLSDPKASLRVQSSPSGATVFLDGVFQGMTPFDIQDVPLGKHFIRLVLPEGKKEEWIEKNLVEGRNEVEVRFAPGTTDPYTYFQTLGSQKELSQARATYLDEMGLALGADIFLLLTPLQGKVRGQLYDQRSQELSQEITESNPQSLVQRLLSSLGSDGYVVAGQASPDIEEKSGAGIALKPKIESEQNRAIDYKKPKQQKKVSKPWYKNHWIWIGIGAGALAAGAGVYLGSTLNSSTNSTVTATIP